MIINKEIKKNKFLVLIMCCMFSLTQIMFLFIPAKKASASDEYIRIKNVWQQNYLYEDNGQVMYGNVSVDNRASQWLIEDSGSGSVRIKNRKSGNYMNVEHLQSYVECTPIDSTWYSGKWTIEDAGSNQKRIKNVWKNNNYIHVENLQGYAQQGTINSSWDSAKWIFENVDETPTQPTNPTQPQDHGATMPYTRYESEDSIIGGGASLRQALDFNYSNTASEASNQKYVALPSNGSYAEWTVNQGGAGVNMRFIMPDSSDGMGLNGSLDVYVNGTKVKTVSLSSYWSWQYFSGDQPQDTLSGGTQAAFRFDEVHFKLDTALKLGDKLRIQKTNGDNIEYGVDFVEVEPVPAAISKPANSYSVTDYGAVSNDNKDDLAAFNACVNAAAKDGKSVYIPEGKFDLGGMWTINANNITITGAGMWYTNIQFTSPNAASGGISLKVTGTLDFSNVYLNSKLRSRYNQQAVYKCFMDQFGTNSKVHDFWEEHFEAGFWVADYAHNPAVIADGLVISNGRVRNNLADGINFCQGTKNSTVQNCSVRNNGDDGLAMWPDSTMGAPMEVNNTFKYNTIENNWRAAGIAIFGGSGHKATNNYIKDCFMGSGIRLNTVFPGYHFENNTGITFSDNTIVNCGTSKDCYGGERGAIDLEASNTGIKNITFNNIDIINAQRDAIQIGYVGGFQNINFNNITIDGTGKDAITTSKFAQPHDGAAIFAYTNNGTVNFTNLKLKNIESTTPYIVQSGFNLSFK